MSTCVSTHGEYSQHQLTDPADPLTCQWCFVFDEDAARDRLRAARFLVGDWQANGNSRGLDDPTADIWHKAARQLLAVLDGREAHDVDPKPTPTPAGGRGSGEVASS